MVVPGRARHSYGEAAAEILVTAGCRELVLSPAELTQTPGSDWRKVAIALALHRHTTAGQAWVGRQLAMGSAVNVSQQLQRLASGKLADPASRWLANAEHELSIKLPAPSSFELSIA